MNTSSFYSLSNPYQVPNPAKTIPTAPSIDDYESTSFALGAPMTTVPSAPTMDDDEFTPHTTEIVPFKAVDWSSLPEQKIGPSWHEVRRIRSTVANTLLSLAGASSGASYYAGTYLLAAAEVIVLSTAATAALALTLLVIGAMLHMKRDSDKDPAIRTKIRNEIFNQCQSEEGCPSYAKLQIHSREELLTHDEVNALLHNDALKLGYTAFVRKHPELNLATLSDETKTALKPTLQEDVLKTMKGKGAVQARVIYKNAFNAFGKEVEEEILRYVTLQNLLDLSEGDFDYGVIRKNNTLDDLKGPIQASYVLHHRLFKAFLSQPYHGMKAYASDCEVLGIGYEDVKSHLSARWQQQPIQEILKDEADDVFAAIDDKIFSAWDWLVKVDADTKLSSVNEIVTLDKRLFKYDMVNLTDLNHKFQQHLSSYTSFEQLHENHPEEIFSRGLCSRETSGVSRLASEFFRNHPEAFVTASNSKDAASIIDRYNLLPAAEKELLNEVRSHIAKTEASFIQAKNELNKTYNFTVNKLQNNYEMAVEDAHINLKIDKLKTNVNSTHAISENATRVFNENKREYFAVCDEIKRKDHLINNCQVQLNRIEKKWWGEYSNSDLFEAQREVRKLDQSYSEANQSIQIHQREIRSIDGEIIEINKYFEKERGLQNLSRTINSSKSESVLIKEIQISTKNKQNAQGLRNSYQLITNHNDLVSQLKTLKENTARHSIIKSELDRVSRSWNEGRLKELKIEKQEKQNLIFSINNKNAGLKRDLDLAREKAQKINTAIDLQNRIKTASFEKEGLIREQSICLSAYQNSERQEVDAIASYESAKLELNIANNAYINRKAHLKRELDINQARTKSTLESDMLAQQKLCTATKIKHVATFAGKVGKL